MKRSLALVLLCGALLTTACGSDSPTTPAAPSPPAPEPQPQRPGIPTNLQVASETRNLIQWDWDDVPGADSYEVELYAPQIWIERQTRTARESRYAERNLPSQTWVAARVRAVAELKGEWTAYVDGLTESVFPETTEQADYSMSLCRLEIDRYRQDFLRVSVTSRIHAEQILVTAHFDHGADRSTCNVKLPKGGDVFIPGRTRSDDVFPEKCGGVGNSEAQWRSVTIEPADSYTCEGCGIAYARGSVRICN